MVEWNDAQEALVPYRSITDFINSSCKPGIAHHGIFSDKDFDAKLDAVRYARNS